jgi:hypothetical protein
VSLRGSSLSSVSEYSELALAALNGEDNPNVSKSFNNIIFDYIRLKHG